MGARTSFRWLGWSPALALLAALTCSCAGKSARDLATGGAGGAGLGGSVAAGAGGAGLGGSVAGGASGSAGTVAVAPFAACQKHTDCVVTHPGCCDSCGQTTLENVVALRREALLDYRDTACAANPQPCRACASFSNPYLVARCVEGQCATLDLFQPPFIDCSVSEDCRLRTNACCPCQDSAALISVSAAQESRLRAELCDADATCDDCTSVSVTDVDAGCLEGRCVLLFFPR